MTQPIEEIRDFLKIGGDIFTAGQPTPQDIINLGAAGFAVVINLSTATGLDAIPNEMDLVREAGMAYVHIPVEWQNPTRADLEKFFSMFSHYKSFKTFVHCARNMRVSSFIFLFRVLVEQQDRETCWEDVLQIWQPNPDWQTFIDQMLNESWPKLSTHELGDWPGYTNFKGYE